MHALMHTRASRAMRATSAAAAAAAAAGDEQPYMLANELRSMSPEVIKAFVAHHAADGDRMRLRVGGGVWRRRR